MLSDKLPGFSSENTARRGLEQDNGRWPLIGGNFHVPKGVQMGKVHRCIQASFDDFMVGKFGAIKEESN